MFGIHTAMAGIMFPFMAKVDEMVWNRIYEKLSPSPIPKCKPIPPLTFREDSDKPIEVRINAANDIAIRRWYYNSKSLILAKPRCFCLLMYSLS